MTIVHRSGIPDQSSPDMSQTTIELAQTKTTDHSAVDAALSRLREGASSLTGCTLEERIRLASECIQGVAEVATAWVESACQAKAIPPGSAARSEEITAGPVSVLRYLRLFIRTLEDIQRSGSPRLPGAHARKMGSRSFPFSLREVSTMRLSFIR